MVGCGSDVGACWNRSRRWSASALFSRELTADPTHIAAYEEASYIWLLIGAASSKDDKYWFTDNFLFVPLAGFVILWTGITMGNNHIVNFYSTLPEKFTSLCGTYASVAFPSRYIFLQVHHHTYKKSGRAVCFKFSWIIEYERFIASSIWRASSSSYPKGIE